MTRSDRLKPIVEFKDLQQKKCLQDMAGSKNRWGHQKTQLDNLYLYQNEYHTKQAHGVDTFSVMQLIEERRFIDQLNETIKQQTLIVQQAEREYLIKQKHWLRMKNNASAVENLVDNLHDFEKKDADKKEQKMLDEYGLRKKIIT